MNKLINYVAAHAERGPCCCGRCIDAVAQPREKQPEGHTADVVFFQVRANQYNKPTPDGFLKLVQEEYPQILDGDEHSYIEIGAHMGDQGLGLMTMALGGLLGVWQLKTPKNMVPGIPEDDAQRMAALGMVTIEFP